jgi:iron complex outermembrane receptor protein
MAMKNVNRKTLVSTLALLPAVCPGGALAQQLEEVLVTAQRRSESIEDVPLSVAAISGENITVGKIADLNDIAFAVPGVTFNEFNVGEPRFYIRGIGNSSDSAASDQAVGVFLDEVYIGRTGGVGFDLLDLERIEILRGPQGTLYGKNTNGGAINVVTMRPSQENLVKLSASVGNYDMYNLNGLVNGGIADSVAGKLVLQYQERDGFGKNVITPEEIATDGDFSASRLIGGSIGASGSGDKLDDLEKYSVRGQLQWDLSDSMSLLLGADYAKNKTNGSCRHLQNLDEAVQGLGVLWALGMSDRYMNDDRHCSTQIDTDQEREIKGGMVRFDWTMDWADFMSLTAYRESDYDFVDDLTGIPLLDLNAPPVSGTPLPPLPGVFTPPENVIDGVDEQADQFSQEFRFTGSTGSLDWVAGAFYMEENVNRKEEFYTQYNTLLQLGFGLAAIGDVLFTQDNETTSMALYGQADWHITDRWTLTYGVRWSDDEKKITQNAIDLLGTTPTGVPLIAPEFPQPVKADDSWSEVTNKASISYSPTDEIMLYATYSEGFKSGAFPSQANLPSVAGQSVDPEQVTNYEAGVKSSWWNNRIQFNASYYFMDYDDLQVFELNNRLLLVLLSAQAESEGVDVDFNVLVTENFMISSSYNYNDATYTDFIDSGGNDVSDNSLVFAPENAFAISADYRLDLDSAGALNFNVNYAWKDDYFTAASNAEKTRQDDIGMIGASAGWTSADQRWEVVLWGKNLDDEQQIANRIVDPTQITSEMYMPPRTYGATMTVTF